MWLESLEGSPREGLKKDTKDAHQSACVEELDSSKRPPGDGETNKLKLRAFRFSELVTATENFKLDKFLGEGGFGKVFKGFLADTGQVSCICCFR